SALPAEPVSHVDPAEKPVRSEAGETDPAWMDLAGSSYEARGRILTWGGGKQSACSITFDDGTLDQFAYAAPILEEDGIRGSFFIITGARADGQWRDGDATRDLFTWEQAAVLLANGHEIGSHSVDHPDMRQLEVDGNHVKIQQELRESAVEIRRNLPSNYLPPEGGLTFCWPFWRTTPGLESEAARYYLASRGGKGLPSGPVVKVPYGIHSVMVLSHDSLPAWDRRLELNTQRRGWIVFAFHGFITNGERTGSNGWEPIKIGKLEALLDLLRERACWVAPFGDVYRYAVERHAAELKIGAITEKNMVLTLEDGLDDILYDQPLTLDVLPPPGFEVKSIQNEAGTRLEYELLENGWIRFDTLPDGRPVTIRF
ncbi:MAG: polysaccharide deacetylase family protein, partial [Sediminispirochaetaceae bacterium]